MPPYFSDKTRSTELPTYFNYLPTANPLGAIRGLQDSLRTDFKVLPEHTSWLDNSLLPMIMQKLELVTEERTGGRDSWVYRELQGLCKEKNKTPFYLHYRYTWSGNRMNKPKSTSLFSKCSCFKTTS